MNSKILVVIFLLFAHPSKAWWQQTNGPYGGHITCLAASGSVVFAGTAAGVFVSANSGGNWTAANSGLTSTDIRSLLINGSSVFAGTLNGGIFVSINNGNSWTAANTGLPNYAQVNAFAINGTTLYAGTSRYGIYISTNNGNSWTAANVGIPNSTTFQSFTVSGTSVFAGSYGRGVFLSVNNGSSWTAVNTGLTNLTVTAMASIGSNIFTGTNYNGIFLSTNNGSSWSGISHWPMSSGAEVASLSVSGTNLFAGVLGQSRGAGGLFLTGNNGSSWTKTDSGFFNKDVRSMALSGNNFYAGTDGGGVYWSGNNGVSWTGVSNGIRNTEVRSLAVSGSGIIAGTLGGGLFSSPNSGGYWPSASSGLATTEVMSLGVSGSTVFAGMAYDGIYKSVNGTNWSSTSLTGTGFSFKAIASSGSSIYAGGPGGAFLSINGGSNWTAINNGLSTGWINALACLGTTVFAGTDAGGIYLSTNNGANWIDANVGVTSPTVYALATSASDIFAGGSGGVFLSTDNGNSWTAKNNGLAGQTVFSLAVNGTTVYAGTNGGGVFVSIDYGNHWSKTGMDGLFVFTLAINGPNLFAGTISNGVWSRPICSSSVTQNLSICSGQSVTVGTHTYFSSGTYSDTLVNLGGCDSIVTTNLTVDSVTAATITAGGSTALCGGNSVQLYANTGNGLNYQWKQNGVNISFATNSSYTANIQGNYTCTISNACGSATSNAIAVTVLSMPSVPGAISGQSTGICGNTESYSIAPVAGATNYSWTVPAGVTINSGQGTTSLTVSYPVPFAGGSIGVRAENACGVSALSSKTASSNFAPAGPILGLTAVCAQKRYVYSIAPVEGATSYYWTVPLKASIILGQGTPTIDVKMFKSSGNITVTVSNACTSAATIVLPVSITEVGCGRVHRDERMVNADVYPNPSSTEFTLKIFSEDDSPCLVIVRDVTGRELERRSDVSPGAEITFGNQLANGIYLAEVLQGEDRMVLKVMKSQ